MYFIGIDGGGTSTTGVIGTSDGHILAYQTIHATNPNRVGLDTSISRLQQLLHQLRAQHTPAYEHVQSVYCGISGASQLLYQQTISQALMPLLPKECTLVVNHDALAALYSGTLGNQGIIQISGTGSVSYALDDRHLEHRVGGWGYLLGDEGSGFSIGRAALRATLDEDDNPSILHSLITNHFNASSISDVIPVIYKENGHHSVAQLSPLVFKAYEQKDSTATMIMANEAKAIARNLIKLTKKATFQDVIPVVLTGGLFEHNAIFLSLIQSALSKQKDQYVFITPSLSPVIGALIAAIQPQEQLPSAFERNAVQTMAFIVAEPTLSIQWAKSADTLAQHLESLNRPVEAHIGYCGSEATEIEHSLNEEAIPFSEALIASKDDQVVGILFFDFDEEEAYVWGPFLHIHENELLAIQLWHGHPKKKRGVTYDFFINKENTSTHTFLSNLGASQTGTHVAMTLHRDDYHAAFNKKVHVYNEHDKHAFASIHDEAFPTTYYNSDTILQRLNHKRRLLVYKDNERVCGYAFIEANPDHEEGNIEYIAVKESERGKGIGKAILQHAITLLFDEYNLSKLELTVSAKEKRTIQLYKSVGFATTHTLHAYSLKQ
ncbi:GNAT family N-acetyltransferase [Shouchella sp. 1P09AA]|uniref:GNAT family N-acetyltransferase n=1 Tax=unclassified Shouchella TaxID=2893065 RepID=UPI0039A0C829